MIFGGSRTPENLGYGENVNLYRRTHCSPCWIHEGDGDVCGYDLKCLKEIPVTRVFEAVTEVIDARSAENPV